MSHVVPHVMSDVVSDGMAEGSGDISRVIVRADAPENQLSLFGPTRRHDGITP
ncbi:MAG: hypothetical protein AAF668_02250 [Pseudomonadota bacterium]